MTTTEFLEKYHNNPEITIALGENYIVAYQKKDWTEVERVDCPNAGAIAMMALLEMVALLPNLTK